MKSLFVALGSGAMVTLLAGAALADNAPTVDPGKLPLVGDASAPTAGTPPPDPDQFNAGFQDAKVFASDGARVGTVVSTTTGTDGSFLTIEPTSSFVTGLDGFQVPASATTTDDQNNVMLNSSATTLLSSIESQLPPAPATSAQ